MAQSQGPQKWQCDCALTFDNKLSLRQHVQATGHLKERWCTQCSRLFCNKEALEQHKNAAPKHERNPTVPPIITNADDEKSRVGKPKTASGCKPMTPLKTTRAAKEKKKIGKTPTPKGISNGGQPKSSATTLISESKVPSPTGLSSALATKYPWASKSQSPELINALEAQCHADDCLLYQGYYTGNPHHRGHHKFNIKNFISAPASVHGLVKRKAIAIDCEMVEIAKGKNELARICAMDLLTGETLIDMLVYPTEPVIDWRSRYSGITLDMMLEARLRGQTLDGWPAARERLFEFADVDTMLVGHALNNDLKVLKVSHKRVVDSSILVGEAVFGKGKRMPRQWGLNVASKELLKISIQTSRRGHDCMEDTLATRELVLWCLREREKLEAWGAKALIKYEEQRRKIRERQMAEAKARKEKKERELELEWNPEKQQQLPILTPAANDDWGHDDDNDCEHAEDYDEKFEFPLGGHSYAFHNHETEYDSLWRDME
ncbi:ribonuclease H-like protein [Jackrogersella minutella]|nr:ribonuclease H-like protein [Jackrogersella minutella]